MVENALWHLGAITYSEKLSLSTVYKSERGSQNGRSCPNGDFCNDTILRTTEWVGKIGLMYISDYGYASKDSQCANDLVGSDSKCKYKNWLHPTSDYYWSFTAASNDSYAANAIWDVGSSDCADGDTGLWYESYVRPTLYLSSKVKIISGNGDTIP